MRNVPDRNRMKEIKVLGTGCPNCNRLEERTKQAVDTLDLDATITKVTDIREIMSFGVMTTPALVVDGKVVLAGHVPLERDIRQLLADTV